MLCKNLIIPLTRRARWSVDLADHVILVSASRNLRYCRSLISSVWYVIPGMWYVCDMWYVWCMIVCQVSCNERYWSIDAFELLALLGILASGAPFVPGEWPQTQASHAWVNWWCWWLCWCWCRSFLVSPTFRAVWIGWVLYYIIPVNWLSITSYHTRKTAWWLTTVRMSRMTVIS